jgi:hypothetical protein
MTIATKPETVFTLTIDSQETKVWYWPVYSSGRQTRRPLGHQTYR